MSKWSNNLAAKHRVGWYEHHEETPLDVLENKLNKIEEQLNVYGYTMQEEPKEFKYHVNALKGRDDE